MERKNSDIYSVCLQLIRLGIGQSNDSYHLDRVVDWEAVLALAERQGLSAVVADGIDRLKVLEEEVLKMKYPNAYNYLLSNQEELAKRDNGHKKYPMWYAYGRSQALNLKGERLLFPHICDSPCFTYCNNDTLLFYEGIRYLPTHQESWK